MDALPRNAMGKVLKKQLLSDGLSRCAASARESYA